MNESQKTVAVVGLGYVGLPLACLCAEKEYKVYAIDIDERKVNLIKKKISPIQDKEVQEALKKIKLDATTDLNDIKKAEIAIVCVPTPIDEKYNPDLNPLKSACQAIRKNLKKGHLVIIESTINPGVCEEVVCPILEESGLKAGIDFDVAHCPERIDPGNKKWSLRNIPRVVGSTSKKGLERALFFYGDIIEAETKPMKSIKEAEATKIIENTFRDINIAFINELAKSFDKMGIDLVNVIEGSSTKPFAFLAHYPGCGIGGHCIPVDPYYLIERAKQLGFDHKFLKLAREINKSMPAYTVELLVKELNGIKKSMNGTAVGVLGLAYKADIDDVRESPCRKIIELLKELKADVQIYDPFIAERSTVNSLDELLQKSEALVLATAHSEFVNMDLGLLKDNGIRIVVDGRNCLDKKRIKKMGIIYKGVGR